MNARRTAIVTGASSGIGMALAERAVRSGWNVFAAGRRTERLEELARKVELANGTRATLALDVRAPQAAKKIVRGALERFGRIDVLVNNAGGVAVGPIAQQTDGALAEQVETHVVAPLALTREALPALRASRGHVFFVGSGVARVPVGLLGAYPPVKAAVRNMTRIVRNELRADGIAVTYVDPGAVATEFMTRAGFAGPPPGLAASPHRVARRIFDAFSSRRSVVNGVPWQTFVVAIAEALPGITDFVLQRAPQIVLGDAPLPATPVEPALIAPTEPAPIDDAPLDPVDAALVAHTSRMSKLKMSASYIRGLLVPGAELELGDVALGWAGMPNKNERALTNDVLDALADAGLLEHLEPEHYKVKAD
ncbi:MAG: SDR family NAD(P)-dependent oxidoreductase [Candidatus Eremiobacteraeota bacterium]|nr:SDR family NAD(P)-dependent oxidoreductase [Candidatus Eremiobacteraeota bacterium]